MLSHRGSSSAPWHGRSSVVSCTRSRKSLLPETFTSLRPNGPERTAGSTRRPGAGPRSSCDAQPPPRPPCSARTAWPGSCSARGKPDVEIKLEQVEENRGGELRRASAAPGIEQVVERERDLRRGS